MFLDLAALNSQHGEAVARLAEVVRAHVAELTTQTVCEPKCDALRLGILTREATACELLSLVLLKSCSFNRSISRMGRIVIDFCKVDALLEEV